MDQKHFKVLLVTANVGSIFEDPAKMMKMWLKEFLLNVKNLYPDFLAVHCQEVGGKNYEESMQHVNQFVKTLLASDGMQEYDKARVFLDEDFTAVDKFTALGCLYFIRHSLHNVQIWDFQESSFVSVKGREVLSGNIEDVPIIEKAKFPQEFFPDFKWSRKGFIRTRWNICNNVFDLTNIHLFHDASNIVAMETSPSAYCANRMRALNHTLARFENDKYPKVPCFIFGDFNFRLDTQSLIKKLTEKASVQHTKGKKNEISKIVYKAHANDQPILTVEKKSFEHEQHNEVFSNNNGKWLHEFDREPHQFKDKLFEFEVTFPPSYPFSEDTDNGASYMKTRCPSWCDRIMLSQLSADIIAKDSGPPEYNIMGPNICMGDHKPIYLNFKIPQATGNQGLNDTVDTSSSTPNEKPPLRKVISINGEEVEIQNEADFNIHDFATFEREQHITRKFMSTIKRKPSVGECNVPPQSHRKRPSFKATALEVVRVESVLAAMRHFTHRSDSESDTEDENVTNHTRNNRKKNSASTNNNILIQNQTKPTETISSASHSFPDLNTENQTPVPRNTDEEAIELGSTHAHSDQVVVSIGESQKDNKLPPPAQQNTSATDGKTSRKQRASGEENPKSASLQSGVTSQQQVCITETDTTKCIHVRQNGASDRTFKETAV